MGDRSSAPGAAQRAAPLLGGTLLALAIVQTRGVANDDAYITYRYASNLASGLGLVFNAGERVLATPSPLYAALLTPVAAITSAVPLVSNVIGCIAVAAQVWLVWRLLGALDVSPIARVLAVVFLSGGGLGPYWHLGLEANLAAALLLGALVAAHERRWMFAPILAALSALARPDAVLLGALLFGWSCRDAKGARSAVRGWALFAAVGVLWLAFSTWYYGSPLPASLGAKRGATPGDVYLYRAGIALGSAPLSWAIPRSPLCGDLDQPTFANMSVGLVTWAAALFGAWSLRSRSSSSLLAIYPVVFLLAHSLIGPPLGHAWHLYPAQLYLFALFAGAVVGGDGLLRRFPLPACPSPLGAVLVCLAWALGSAFLLRFPELQRRDPWLFNRAASLTDMAAAIRSDVPPGEPISALEIGILGYETPNPYIDRAGLATPGLVWHDARRRTSLEDSLTRHPTDWLVILESDYQRVAATFREVHRSEPYGPLLLVKRR